MKTPEMQEKTEIRNKLKEQIDVLQKEKAEIDLFNKEITMKHNQITKAKQQIQALENECEDIRYTIDLINKQLRIATRLNLLMIQKQMKEVKQYLTHVSIVFNSIDEQSGAVCAAAQKKLCSLKKKKKSTVQK